MKILYFIPSLNNPGGMERILTLKVNYFVEKFKYDITIVTAEKENYTTSFFYLSEKVNVLRLNICFNDHFNDNIFLKYYKHCKKMNLYKKQVENVIEKYKPDICISLFGKEFDFLYKIIDKSVKIAEIHFAKDFRKQFLKARKKGIFWEFIGNCRTRKLEKIAKKYSKIIVLTKEDQETWLKTNDNILCIPNANPIVSEKKSDCSSKNVITVGRLDPQKGYDMLIKAWKIVNEKFPNWKLNIYGSGDLKNQLYSQIEKLSLQESVFIYEPIKNIENEYVKSSIYVMSSRYEGFGMVLLEAMSCGLPCVSFDCNSGPKDIIIDNHTGYLVKIDDVNMLADKVLKLINDDILRKKMGENSILQSNKFNIENIALRWHNLFIELTRN